MGDPRSEGYQGMQIWSTTPSRMILQANELINILLKNVKSRTREEINILK